PVVPPIGMAWQPGALAGAGTRAATRLAKQGWTCDVLDAHYLYPDGVAAAHVARELGVPFVVTARGSDVNLVARMPGPRQRILAALAQAGGIIAVSAALKQALADLGVAPERIEVLRNGVDTTLFAPTPNEPVRAQLRVGNDRLVVSVGNLVAEKGHDLVLAAV